MKKLLLASDGKFLFETGYKLLGIPIKDLRIGYVTTASKGTDNTNYLELHKKSMKEMGLRFEEMDIEGKCEAELRRFLSTKNVAHIEGGNTFYLLRAIRQTGFDKILAEFVEKGLIYIGTSAGSYVACATIETSTWKSQRDRYGITDLRAMHFVPFILKAHYTDDMRPLVQEKKKNLKYPLLILRDGQAVLVEGDKYTFVGEGKEVIL